MRIAMFTELYPPHIGGQEVRFAELARALARAGHDVTVHCVGHDKSLAAAESREGVAIRRWPFNDHYVDTRAPGAPRSPLTVARFAWTCRQAALANDYDVLLYNQWPIAHVLAIPEEVRPRSAVDWCEVRTGAVWSAIQSRLPRRVGMNFAVSSAVADAISEQSGQRVVCLPSGVDVASYDARPRRERWGLLHLGRIADHKRLPLLVDAYEAAADMGFDESLIIAGSGPALGSLRERVARLPRRLRDSVEIPGNVSEERKRQLLASAKLMVITSRREGFPRVVAEAMASELPVVTTNDPGNGTRSVVMEYRIGHVADSKPSAIAGAIMSAVGDWDELSSNAASAAPSLDWAPIVATFLSAVSNPDKRKNGGL